MARQALSVSSSAQQAISCPIKNESSPRRNLTRHIIHSSHLSFPLWSSYPFLSILSLQLISSPPSIHPIIIVITTITLTHPPKPPEDDDLMIITSNSLGRVLYRRRHSTWSVSSPPTPLHQTSSSGDQNPSSIPLHTSHTPCDLAWVLNTTFIHISAFVILHLESLSPRELNKNHHRPIVANTNTHNPKHRRTQCQSKLLLRTRIQQT